jgi:kynurenine---oxoglutarate transaminase / cysteine-S-conjugate beta-lyase / glutamine---phenylpyruvate transaminase
MKEMLSENNWQFHQYTRSQGHPRLVNAIAKLYSKLINHQIDPMTEVIVTAGAYGSLFNACTSILSAGDEVFFFSIIIFYFIKFLLNFQLKVIIIEPFFDCYGNKNILAIKNLVIFS